MSEYAQSSSEDRSQRPTVSLHRLELLTVGEPTAVGRKGIHGRRNRETMSRFIEKREECGEKVETLSFQGFERASASGAPASSNFMPKQEGAEGRTGSFHLHRHPRVCTARFRRLLLVLRLLDAWILNPQTPQTPAASRPRTSVRVMRSHWIVGQALYCALPRGLVANVSFVTLCTMRL